MAFKDLREFISLLEEKGDLRRIEASVSRDLEMSEIADRVVKSGGPALYFENVEGFDMPAVMNLFGAERRVAWALGVDKLDDLAERTRDLLGMLQGPPTGIGDKLRALGKLAGVARAQPKTVSRGQAADHQVLADGRGPLHHVSPCDKPRPGDGQAQRGHLPDAGVRRQDDGDALADAQGGGETLQGG